MSDPRRPGEEEQIERFLAERGATLCPPGGQADPVMDAMLAARAAGNAAKGKARGRAHNNSYWKRVQAERRKRSDG